VQYQPPRKRALQKRREDCPAWRSMRMVHTLNAAGRSIITPTLSSQESAG
jgi:hypothetical protein